MSAIARPGTVAVLNNAAGPRRRSPLVKPGTATVPKRTETRITWINCALGTPRTGPQMGPDPDAEPKILPMAADRHGQVTRQQLQLLDAIVPAAAQGRRLRAT